MRQVRVRALAAEAELQHLHAGLAEFEAQLIDFRSDEAQVFCNQRKRTERGFKSAEEFEARRLDPLAVDGGFLVGGNRPVGFETAEVVEADDVVKLARAADAVDPPAESLLGENIPVVKRIAPALAGGREVVGRYAGDADGLEFIVEFEQLGVNPDVG